MSPPGTDRGAKQQLRGLIADWSGLSTDSPNNDVLLYPTGMAAIAACLRGVLQRSLGTRQNFSPGKTIQLGFPYIDTLKLQEKLGVGVHLIADMDDDGWHRLTELLQAEPISAVFCEFSGNPLLTSLDLPRLSKLLEKHRVPLVVDDTIATFANVDLKPYADIIISSLTKYVSGSGDVMGGSIVCPSPRDYAFELFAKIAEDYEDIFWVEDAAVLLRNAKDFPERIAVINHNATLLADFLHSHPAVEQVYFPKLVNRACFDAVRRITGGYGGLMSVLVRDAEQRTPSFHDRLEVCKGPSLGTNFTLACPYTLLAHYHELEWAESFGVSRYLIRISVGLEPIADLISRFERALA